jgi:hypothetical protein
MHYILNTKKHYQLALKCVEKYFIWNEIGVVSIDSIYVNSKKPFFGFHTIYRHKLLIGTSPPLPGALKSLEAPHNEIFYVRM